MMGQSAGQQHGRSDFDHRCDRRDFPVGFRHQDRQQYEDWLASKDFLVFVEPAKSYLEKYSDKDRNARDLAYAVDGVRYEMAVTDLPKHVPASWTSGRKPRTTTVKSFWKPKRCLRNGPAGVKKISSSTAPVRWTAIGGPKVSRSSVEATRFHRRPSLSTW